MLQTIRTQAHGIMWRTLRQIDHASERTLDVLLAPVDKYADGEPSVVFCVLGIYATITALALMAMVRAIA